MKEFLERVNNVLLYNIINPYIINHHCTYPSSSYKQGAMYFINVITIGTEK